VNSTILVVDDSADLREVLRDVLADEGYEVALAASGREALDYLRTNPPPSLILLDVGMPDMDGTTFLAHRARDAALAAIPVVLLSGVSDLSAQAALAGVPRLEKPVNLDELLAVVGRHCMRTPRP